MSTLLSANTQSNNFSLSQYVIQIKCSLSKFYFLLKTTISSNIVLSKKIPNIFIHYSRAILHPPFTYIHDMAICNYQLKNNIYQVYQVVFRILEEDFTLSVNFRKEIFIVFSKGIFRLFYGVFLNLILPLEMYLKSEKV